MINYRRRGDESTNTIVDADLDGTVDVVVPLGTYTVWSLGAVQGIHGQSSAGQALLAQTGVVVADTYTALDGTKLRRTKAVTPRPPPTATSAWTPVVQ